MSNVRTVVLDNEAVQALLDPHHTKHRRSVMALESVADRVRERLAAGGARTHLVVPTSVRVEAGWDRRRAAAAAANRLRADDHHLDGPSADIAAALRSALGVSVADAHIGAALATTPGPHAVLTSDPRDVARLADELHATVRIVVL